MSATKVTRDVDTVGDLRAFLAACEVMDVPDDAEVRVHTRFGFSSDGMPLKDVTARSEDRRTESR